MILSLDCQPATARENGQSLAGFSMSDWERWKSGRISIKYHSPNHLIMEKKYAFIPF
jgi:hypothetical protein